MNVLSGWMILSTLIILSIVIPNLNIIIRSLGPTNDNWTHIKTYLLNKYVFNSILLIVFTGLFTIIIGSFSAWLVTMFEFPGRKFFSWAFVLPIAIPPYIGAYTYHGILNYTGVIQTFLRNSLNITVSQKYFSIMNIRGAVFIFVLFLYPYVYMTTRSSLKNMSFTLIESAQLLGKSFSRIFMEIVIPISRVAIVGGVSLVILEVLNDYGVVKYFGVPVFSTAIYSTWFGMGDVDSAMQLAVRLMGIVMVVIILEKVLQGRRKYANTTGRIVPIKRQALSGRKRVAAIIYSTLLFSVAFLVPVLQLIYWMSLVAFEKLDIEFFIVTRNSILLAGFSSILIVVSALIVANFSRISKGKLGSLYSKITILGYSIPASVIAIGIMTIFLSMDRSLYPIYKMVNPESKKLLMSSSIGLLISAYYIRFLAIGFNPIESGFKRIGKKYLESSRLLGKGVTETFFRIDLPLLRVSVISSFILVFVDVLKELPLTLILRPFNFNTLATRAFEYANDEMIHEASIASLIIILVSVIAIYLLNRLSESEGVR